MLQGMISARRITLLFPWATVTLILAFAGMAWWQVGHWPYYSHPDPKDVVVSGAEVGFVMWILIAVSLLASLVGAIGIVVYHLCVLAKQGWSVSTASNRRALKDLAYYGFGLLCAFLVLGRNIGWLVD